MARNTEGLARAAALAAAAWLATTIALPPAAERTACAEEDGASGGLEAVHAGLVQTDGRLDALLAKPARTRTEIQTAQEYFLQNAQALQQALARLRARAQSGAPIDGRTEALAARCRVRCEQMRVKLSQLRGRLHPNTPEIVPDVVDASASKAAADLKKTIARAMEEGTMVGLLRPESRAQLEGSLLAGIDRQVRAALQRELGDVGRLTLPEAQQAAARLAESEVLSRLEGFVVRSNGDVLELQLEGEVLFRARFPDDLHPDLQGVSGGAFEARIGYWRTRLRAVQAEAARLPARSATPSRTDATSVREWLARADGVLRATRLLADDMRQAGDAAGAARIAGERARLQGAVDAARASWGTAVADRGDLWRVGQDEAYLAALLRALESQPVGGEPGPDRPREGGGGEEEDPYAALPGTWVGSGGALDGVVLTITKSGASFDGRLGGATLFSGAWPQFSMLRLSVERRTSDGDTIRQTAGVVMDGREAFELTIDESKPKGWTTGTTRFTRQP